MGIFRFTARDINARKLVQPDWYPTIVLKVEDTKAQDGSGLTIVHVTGLTGDAKDVEARIMISEKAPGIQGIPLLNATGTEVAPEVDFNISDGTMKDKTFDAYWGHSEPRKGRTYNEIQEFAPIGAMTQREAQA